MLNEEEEMTDIILWGRHPDYANGAWIKLTRNPNKQEKTSREAEGFELEEIPCGQHPRDQQHEDGEIRIYVACLAAYNNGILHGRWIDVTKGEDHVWEGIKAMLNASPIAGAEEHAIHDYEGFEGAPIEEYSSVEYVCALANFIEEHGAVGGKLIEYFSDLEDAKKAIEDNYCGVYSSVADYAQELTEQCTTIPENLQFYINWEAMGRDLEINDVLAIETGFEEVHIFWRQ